MIESTRLGAKSQVKLEDAVSEVPKVLEQIQTTLYDRAAQFLKDNIRSEDNYPKFKERLESEEGFFRMHWCGSDDCEAKVKEETKATIRCVPMDDGAGKEEGKCIYCGGVSCGRVIFARNY